jgi:hypothetical protein
VETGRVAVADPGTLAGRRLPSLSFHGTDGRPVDLGALGPGRSVIFVCPLTGRPGVDLPNGLAARTRAGGRGRAPPRM